MQYPEGSTYKLVTGTGALADKKLTPTTLVMTHPYIQIGADKFWDWNKRGFGALNILGGFADSSDTFFYQVAQMLGIQRLAYWAHQYGFGAPTGIDLPGEVSGIVPDEASGSRPRSARRSCPASSSRPGSARASTPRPRSRS